MAQAGTAFSYIRLPGSMQRADNLHREHPSIPARAAFGQTTSR